MTLFLSLAIQIVCTLKFACSLLTQAPVPSVHMRLLGSSPVPHTWWLMSGRQCWQNAIKAVLTGISILLDYWNMLVCVRARLCVRVWFCTHVVYCWDETHSKGFALCCATLHAQASRTEQLCLTSSFCCCYNKDTTSKKRGRETGVEFSKQEHSRLTVRVLAS